MTDDAYLEWCANAALDPDDDHVALAWEERQQRAPVWAPRRCILAFKDGPLEGEMRKFKSLSPGLLVVDEGTYDVTDPRLANGMMFARFVV